jgi:hypothetical protein
MDGDRFAGTLLICSMTTEPTGLRSPFINTALLAKQEKSMSAYCRFKPMSLSIVYRGIFDICRGKIEVHTILAEESTIGVLIKIKNMCFKGNPIWVGAPD